jgi:ABC-type bacteriocin/lantibiotic exporter with double-glycine peptidase domain
MIYPTVFKDGFGAENRGTTVILTYFMLKYSAYFIPSYKHFITDRLIGKRVFSLSRSVHIIILAIAMFPFMLKILKSVEPQILISPMNDFVHNP